MTPRSSSREISDSMKLVRSPNTRSTTFELAVSIHTIGAPIRPRR
jgi:hypothetical protein